MSLEKNVSTNKIDETYELASIKRVRYIMWRMKLYFRLRNKGKQFMMLYSA